ncbi:unnamed protein product [Auanema sp. JU1783]|nr:unnamed protein product [Auanema sp. JU1783]
MTSPAQFLTVYPDCVLFCQPQGEPFPVYERLARKCSTVLDSLMNTREFQERRVLHLNLNSPNSNTCLRKALEYTATGELNFQDCTIEQMTSLVEELDMNDLRNKMKIPAPQPVALPAFFTNPTIGHNHQQQLSILNALQCYYAYQILLKNNGAPSVDLVTEDKVTKRKSRDRKPSNSADVDEPYDNMGDVIIPSTDNEGWCRNKKYIEKTETGFMCTVCKKVYGRYNSVSYHVTIYHRNPPIKCDISGCQFTTREARYIHFHKYYRHSIPLPVTIDQGTRKCQYCRHVAKSPAMLEKHIKRHANIDLHKNDDSDRTPGPEDESYGRERTVSQLGAGVESMDVDVTTTKPRAQTL